MFNDKITVSYGVEILRISLADKRLFKRTIALYLDAVHFICRVILKNKDNIFSLSKANDRLNYVERLIHSTSKNTAKYLEFDKRFFNMPSYLRRAAVAESIGHMSSYFSNLKNYEAERYEKISNGKSFKKKAPALNLRPNKMPTFFKDNMYLPCEGYFVKLKLFDGKTWKYYKLSLRKTDVDYLSKVKGERCNPLLEFKNNKYYIRYPFQQPHKLCVIKPVKNRTVLAVDLGINTHATCSVMRADGTIIARKFITDATDKTTLNYLLNKKSKLQSESGNWHFAPLSHIQKKINCVNTAIENYTCSEIIKFAKEYNVDVIVFEHLSTFRGKSSEKVHYWRKKAIIKKVCHKSHYIGIRYATVNPRYTSKYAFDGSGFTERGDNIKSIISNNGKEVSRSFSVCRFKNGKFYNCDLNASYNIGARYFYREFKKNDNSLDKASCKVTLSDLWELKAANLKAA